MGITERRQNEINEIKIKIINAAKEILLSEGYEKLSIRKIAAKIEYSPGIIYHYFNDKAEILSFIVSEGYGKILEAISKVPIDMEHPDASIAKGLRAYMELMLEQSNEFKMILMTDIDGIQNEVNILREGISEERKSLKAICDVIKAGIQSNKIKDLEPELTAQILWTSTHGLLSRLILEKDISDAQKERLIEHHFNMISTWLKA